MRQQIIHADCLEWMRQQPDNYIAGIAADPQYGLSGAPDALQMLRDWLSFEEYQHKDKSGFMGKKWDSFVPGPRYWREALRICKPGAFAFVFGGCRTYDLTALAMRIAGWEIRDCIMWVFSGKMLHGINISKAIDKAAGAEREVVGPNIRLGDKKPYPRNPMKEPSSYDISKNGEQCQDSGNITAPATPLAQKFDGYHSLIAPAYEPIIIAMKPHIGTFARNAQENGIAGLNLGECEIPTNGEMIQCHVASKSANFTTKATRDRPRSYSNKGRCAKNLLHDNSPEVLEVFARAGVRSSGSGNKNSTRAKYECNTIGNDRHYSAPAIGGDSGSVARFYQSCPWDKDETARFYYCAKASQRERGAINDWPTVKPLSLMQYLLRLLKQPGDQLYYDPFCGSGSTLVAAKREGMRCIGTDSNAHAVEIAQYRLDNEQQTFFNLL